MATSLESIRSRFVPNSEEKTPPLAKPIDLTIFYSHRKVLDYYGITPDILSRLDCEDGITKCPTGDGGETVDIYWNRKAIVAPTKYYSSQNRFSIVRTD